MSVRNRNLSLDAAVRHIIAGHKLIDQSAATDEDEVIFGLFDKYRDFWIQKISIYLTEAFATAGTLTLGYIGDTDAYLDDAAVPTAASINTVYEFPASAVVGAKYPIKHAAGRLLTGGHTQVAAAGAGYLMVEGVWEDYSIQRAKFS